MFYHKGDSIDLLNSFRSSFINNFRHQIIMRMLLLKVYLKENMKEKVGAVHIKEMKLNKDNANVLVSLCDLYRSIGKIQNAQECYVKARNLNPDL